MSSKLPIDQMLAQLEGKVAHLRERQAFHAKEEAFHQEQAAGYAAELATAVEHLEAFRAAAANADELLTRLGRTAAAADANEDLGKGRPLSRMVTRVVEDKAPGETFGPKAVTREIHKRWGAKLRTRVDPRSVAATLRRWALRGRIQRTREGRGRVESLYVKKKPASATGS
jgi:hypothetical protein